MFLRAQNSDFVVGVDNVNPEGLVPISLYVFFRTLTFTFYDPANFCICIFLTSQSARNDKAIQNSWCVF